MDGVNLHLRHILCLLKMKVRSPNVTLASPCGAELQSLLNALPGAV
jgi:hypothetical protein